MRRFWKRSDSKIEEGRNNEYLQLVIKNLLPQNESYKENIKDIADFSTFIADIHKTEQLQQKKIDNSETAHVMRIDAILEKAFTKLVDVLNCSRDITLPVEVDFELWSMQFEEEVRAIDPYVFPLSRRASRASRYIPPVIQRTSKRLSDKMIHTMVKNTKYHNFTSMTAGQRNRYCNRIMFIVFAWAIALVGTIISVGFLTRDFVLAQRNLAIQIDRSPATPMKLPAITVCSNQAGIPTFSNYPTLQYPGLPLFTVTMYHRGNRSINWANQDISHPRTLPFTKGSPFEEVVVSDGSRPCEAPGFDVGREFEWMHQMGQVGSFSLLSDSGTSCHHCYRIGVQQEEVLKPYDVDQSAAMFIPAIRMAVSKSRLYDFCQSLQIQKASFLEQVLASELYLHAAELERRGVLDFNGRHYSVLLRTLKEQNVERHVNFYCNVYFFSGFFYPSLDGANVSYRYTGDKDVWKPIGSGPYFSTYMWKTEDSLVIGPSPETLRRDIYMFGGIRLYAEEPDQINTSEPVSPETGFAVLDRSMVSSMYTFKKKLVLGKMTYEVREEVSEVSMNAFRLVDTFYLKFDFELFELERVYTYSTMTWSEYVTDVFEFLGLFTGICIFTLIVAPANQVKDGEGYGEEN